MAPITVKVSLYDELRRFKLDDASQTWDMLHAKVVSLFGVKDDEVSALRLKYTDEEGDLISFNTTEELSDALSLSGGLEPPILRLTAISSPPSVHPAGTASACAAKNTRVSSTHMSSTLAPVLTRLPQLHHGAKLHKLGRFLAKHPQLLQQLLDDPQQNKLAQHPRTRHFFEADAAATAELLSKIATNPAAFHKHGDGHWALKLEHKISKWLIHHPRMVAELQHDPTLADRLLANRPRLRNYAQANQGRMLELVGQASTRQLAQQQGVPGRHKHMPVKLAIFLLNNPAAAAALRANPGEAAASAFASRPRLGRFVAAHPRVLSEMLRRSAEMQGKLEAGQAPPAAQNALRRRIIRTLCRRPGALQRLQAAVARGAVVAQAMPCASISQRGEGEVVVGTLVPDAAAATNPKDAAAAAAAAATVAAAAEESTEESVAEAVAAVFVDKPLMAGWLKAHLVELAPLMAAAAAKQAKQATLKTEEVADTEADETTTDAEQGAGHGSPCPSGCGFAVTWHRSHCCRGCELGRGHGLRCERVSLGEAPTTCGPAADTEVECQAELADPAARLQVALEEVGLADLSASEDSLWEEDEELEGAVLVSSPAAPAASQA